MRFIMIVFALAPLLVAASDSDALQGKVDSRELRDDIPATNVMGANVTAGTSEDGGQVKDIVLSSDGRIVAVLVEGAVAGPAADQRVTATEDVAVESGIPGIANDDLARVEWNAVHYNKEDGSVRIDAGGADSSSSESAGEMRIAESRQVDPGDAGSSRSFRASMLVGMEVHLSDAESFGEVEDVLIDQREGKASALLVDAWSGFDKQTFALPVELGSINRGENSLTYGYTKDEVTQLEEYERP